MRKIPWPHFGMKGKRIISKVCQGYRSEGVLASVPRLGIARPDSFGNLFKPNVLILK